MRDTEAAQAAVELRGPHAREAISLVSADMRAMERIADEWSQLSVAGRKFMLSALSAGVKDADRG